MHSNSVFFFDRSGRARLVTTSTDDIAGLTDDVKRLLDRRISAQARNPGAMASPVSAGVPNAG